ncbi:MAG: hypothetical protein WHS46_07020 [Desulfosoma sp.]
MPGVNRPSSVIKAEECRLPDERLKILRRSVGKLKTTKQTE